MNNETAERLIEALGKNTFQIKSLQIDLTYLHEQLKKDGNLSNILIAIKMTLESIDNGVNPQ